MDYSKKMILFSINTMHYRNYNKSSIFIEFRAHIDIPEFYVGSILAVTSSDKQSIGKTTRFVGICIDRGLCGLRSFFVLRNAIDNQGVEIKYELYDPTIQKIEVLLLEKRLDDKMYYLRDAPLEYSKIDENLEAKHHPEGEPVPVNTLQVTLRPRPWMQRWERKDLKGVKQESIDEHITDKMRRQKKMREEPWHKWDLMKEYRATIPEEEQIEIYSDIYPTLSKLRQQRQVAKRSKMFVKPKKAN